MRNDIKTLNAPLVAFLRREGSGGQIVEGIEINAACQRITELEAELNQCLDCCKRVGELEQVVKMSYNSGLNDGKRDKQIMLDAQLKRIEELEAKLETSRRDAFYEVCTLLYKGDMEKLKKTVGYYNWI